MVVTLQPFLIQFTRFYSFLSGTGIKFLFHFFFQYTKGSCANDFVTF